LAVEPHPDVLQAITLLDKTLTIGEKKSILAEGSWLRKQYQPYFDWERQQLMTVPNMHFDTVLASKMREDPGASLLLLTTNSTALNASLEARRLMLGRAQRSRTE
jgi:hypothetical protein